MFMYICYVPKRELTQDEFISQVKYGKGRGYNGGDKGDYKN